MPAPSPSVLESRPGSTTVAAGAVAIDSSNVGIENCQQLDAIPEHSSPHTGEQSRALPPRAVTHQTGRELFPSTQSSGYYITATGGGECYHLTPRCIGLSLEADVMRVVSTDSWRRPCKTCHRVNAKPLIQASEQTSVLMSARHVYYTTDKGKKCHTDRWCSGLRKATRIIEVTSRPKLEACELCSRTFKEEVPQPEPGRWLLEREVHHGHTPTKKDGTP